MFVVNVKEQKNDKGSITQKCIYEVIEFDNKFPLKIFYHNRPFILHHWHEALELIFVLNGSGVVIINGKKYCLNSEEICLVNSNEIHTTFLKDGGIFLVIQISYNFIKENNGQKEVQFQQIFNYLTVPECQTITNDIRIVLLEILMYSIEKKKYNELQIKSRLYSLLYILLNNFKEANKSACIATEKEEKRERLKKIINYIDENFHKDISVGEIANIEHFSISYLSKFFKANTGLSLKEYIIKKRLEHAMKDILSTDLSLLQIALKNGFSDEKSLIKYFKKFYNMCPSQFRKSFKNNKLDNQISSNNCTYYFSPTWEEIYEKIRILLDKYKSKKEDITY